MKIKVYSQTGKPTDVKQVKKYEKEFKQLYDKLWEQYGLRDLSYDKDKRINEFKKSLEIEEKVLKSNYDMYMTVEMPKSGKAWKKLIMDFECPVIIAITEQDKKLALFLRDAEY